MPDRSRKPPRDLNALAKFLVDESTEPHAPEERPGCVCPNCGDSHKRVDEHDTPLVLR